jgi:glycosyltransferase involved in cell wall biosynthesis
LESLEVSFIIPVYNGGKTIVRCLDSVFSQHFSNSLFEVIVVDNNSKDQTHDLLKTYPLIKLVREPLQGRSFARNRGAWVARGKFLAFIDADVFLDEEWLTQMLRAADDPEVAGVQGQIIPQEEDYVHRQSNILLELTLRESPMIDSAACLYRRSIFLAAGGFDIRFNRHEDIDLSRNLLFSGHNLAIAPAALAYVSSNDTALSYYLKRAFDVGFKKIKFLRKWQKLLLKSSSDKNSFHYFYEEVICSLFCSPLHALISFSKSLGRIAGLFSFSNITPIKKSSITKQKRYIFKDGKIYIEIDLHELTIKRLEY